MDAENDVFGCKNWFFITRRWIDPLPLNDLGAPTARRFFDAELGRHKINHKIVHSHQLGVKIYPWAFQVAPRRVDFIPGSDQFYSR